MIAVNPNASTRLSIRPDEPGMRSETSFEPITNFPSTLLKDSKSLCEMLISVDPKRLRHNAVSHSSKNLSNLASPKLAPELRRRRLNRSTIRSRTYEFEPIENGLRNTISNGITNKPEVVQAIRARVAVTVGATCRTAAVVLRVRCDCAGEVSAVVDAHGAETHGHDVAGVGCDGYGFELVLVERMESLAMHRSRCDVCDCTYAAVAVVEQI